MVTAPLLTFNKPAPQAQAFVLPPLASRGEEKCHADRYQSGGPPDAKQFAQADADEPQVGQQKKYAQNNQHDGCDVAIFTSDNPRSENPDQILVDMVGKLSISAPSSIIKDRAAAIRYAVSLASAGDSVVVLGKGHESGQEIEGVITAFDDRLQLAEEIGLKR